MIDEISKKLLNDSRAILEGKKLDPVGKRDADVDNDGDVDSSDEYLGKRRDAIAKAMKDEGNAFTKALAAAKEKGEGEFVVAGKKYQVKEVEELEKDKSKKDIKEKEKDEDEEEVEESVFFEVTESLSPTSKKFIDMMNDMMKHKHGSKEFKAKKKEIDMFLKKNSGKM
tara:strand:- start:1358 stop:1864 length:507 start_codon:yes stop_codon:yes gene_type:complete